MSLEPLASRVFRRDVVENWIRNAPQQFESDDLLNDVLEGRAGSLETFRSALALRDSKPYLGPSRDDLVWCTPSEDMQEQFEAGKTGLELLAALGVSWADRQVIELSYPIAVALPLFKPSSVVAGANPNFQYTSVEEQFGRTIGGLREMIHLPLTVEDALGDGARLREWSI